MLKTFEDSIYVKDLALGEAVEVLRDPNEAIASVMPPKDIEEELEKPIEEKEPEREGEKEEEESAEETAKE